MICSIQDFFKAHQHIACYISFKDEFPTAPLLEMIWQAKKHCYVPCVSEDAHSKHLRFVRYEYGDALHRNRYGILEPVHPREEISPQHLEVVITPLLAFDLEGHRLGTGGGFYDTTFAFLREKSLEKPTLIGLGYEAQEATHLPDDEWDVRLSGIVTEKVFFPS